MTKGRPEASIPAGDPEAEVRRPGPFRRTERRDPFQSGRFAGGANQQICYPRAFGQLWAAGSLISIFVVRHPIREEVLRVQASLFGIFAAVRARRR